MTATLYERLGGRDRLARIVEDAVDNHLRNPKIRHRFENTDEREFRKLAYEFFAAGSGGPEIYSGRDLLFDHLGTDIREEEYVAVIDDVMDALARNSVGQSEKAEVLSLLWSLKGQVVRV
jgi:hemoglobin